jgi:hypothetical protein
VIILKDTREKKGWDFSFYDVETSVGTIKYGDYTTEKLKDIAIIERKASPAELAGNLGKKLNKERFYRELEQLKQFKHAYIVCEFPEVDIYEYPSVKTGVPKSKIKYCRMNGAYIRKLLYKIEEEFELEVIFCNNKQAAEKYALNLFKELEERY